MTRTHFLTFALIGFSFVFALPSMAQDKEKPAAAVPKKEAAKPAKDSPANDAALKKWVEAENALIDPLSEKDKESFFIIRNKYSMLRVIKVVERDVGNAVKSCGEKNADMKDKMDARFKQWKGAIQPILTTAKKQLDKDLAAQKIVDAAKAKEVLKLNDAAFEEGEKKIVKTPVTTKEACEGLLGSMDRTEDDMVKLLQETLLTESAIRARGEAMDKEKAKADAAAKKKAPEKKAE